MMMMMMMMECSMSCRTNQTRKPICSNNEILYYIDMCMNTNATNAFPRRKSVLRGVCEIDNVNVPIPTLRANIVFASTQSVQDFPLEF